MSPMGLLAYPVVLVISLAAIIASAAVFVYLVLRERIRLPKPLMFAVAGVGTAFAFTLEPFRQTLSFGQINIYLALLVLVDLLVLGRRGSKWTGVGIGLATAIKLTPGIFIIYLLVVGRWRAAHHRDGTTVGVTLLSAVYRTNRDLEILHLADVADLQGRIPGHHDEPVRQWTAGPARRPAHARSAALGAARRSVGVVGSLAGAPGRAGR